MSRFTLGERVAVTNLRVGTTTIGTVTAVHGPERAEGGDRMLTVQYDHGPPVRVGEGFCSKVVEQ